MRRIIYAFCLFSALALPAPTSAAARPLAMVPMLPLADGPHLDIEDLLRRQWRGYFQSTGEFGFTTADIRAGRFDLNGDGDPELLVMIDTPKWTSTAGKTFVIATWQDHHWVVIGGSWADEDNILVTDESLESWRTLDTGQGWLRWTKKDGYQAEVK
jgi:hypothetical protein